MDNGINIPKFFINLYSSYFLFKNECFWPTAATLSFSLKKSRQDFATKQNFSVALYMKLDHCKISIFTN